ncbi:hypothetical protein [Geoglobus ahangari]
MIVKVKRVKGSFFVTVEGVGEKECREVIVLHRFGTINWDTVIAAAFEADEVLFSSDTAVIVVRGLEYEKEAEAQGKDEHNLP